jgi:hypothetical protein
LVKDTIMKLFVVKFSTPSFSFLSLSSKYVPQHSDLKHPESIRIHMHTATKSDVGVKWLAPLLRTREVPSSNPIPWAAI